MKTTLGAAAPYAAAGVLPAQAGAAQEKENKTMNKNEIVPGLRAQAKGIKVFVEHEFAPLKAALVGNPSAMYVPDPDFPENARLLAQSSKEMKAFMRKHKGKHLRDADPKLYDEVVLASDSLAVTYRKAGVKLLRNETGKTPPEVVDYFGSWMPDRHLSMYGQNCFEVLENVLVSTWEVPICQVHEFTYRDAMNELFKNNPEATWLSMPVPYPTTNSYVPGPFLSPGDFRIFPEKICIIGIGVPDPSWIKDSSKPRSSGDEYGADIIRRMLKPYGWRVETVYFDSRLTYHIDCLIGLVDAGLIAFPKGSLWTPLPKEFRDWEVIDVDPEEVHLGGCNTVPLGNKQVVLTRGVPKLSKEIAKRGYTPIEVPFEAAYRTFDSGIHCATASIWREYD